LIRYSVVDISFEIILLLLLAATFAGLVDSLAGGGGLIQLPALLVSLPDTSPSVILGTNKVPSFLGTFGATASYLRKVRPDFKLAAVMALPAFIGSALGASVATMIPKDAFRPVILFLLIIVAIYAYLRKDLGQIASAKFERNRRLLIGAIVGAVIGFYDGIFGPGTGSFLMLALVALLGFAFLQASVTAKLVNLATNLGAIAVFGFNSQILWALGLTMAAGNILGGFIGAKAGMKGGSVLIRRAFLVVTTALIIRLCYDTFLRG